MVKEHTKGSCQEVGCSWGGNVFQNASETPTSVSLFWSHFIIWRTKKDFILHCDGIFKKKKACSSVWLCQVRDLTSSQCCIENLIHLPLTAEVFDSRHYFLKKLPSAGRTERINIKGEKSVSWRHLAVFHQECASLINWSIFSVGFWYLMLLCDSLLFFLLLDVFFLLLTAFLMLDVCGWKDGFKAVTVFITK